MKRVDIPFFYSTLPKVAPAVCSSLAISCDQSTANLYLQYCGGKKFAQFLKTILMKIPPTKDNLSIRWSIVSIINSLNEKPSDDLTGDMAMVDFTNLKEQYTKQIMPYISVHKQINDKTAHNLSFYLMLFRNENPGIFYSILPQLQPLISFIGLDRIRKSIGYEFLSFCIAPPIDYFEEMNEIDISQIPVLFQYPISYEAPPFSHYLQSKLTTDFQYPAPFPNIMNSHYFSLLNGTIERRGHFLDLVGSIVSDSIINADIETVKKSTCMFPELLPYFLIVNQAMMYSDLDAFVELLETKYPPSPATNVIDRFKNDFHLLQLMSLLTGTDFCSGDLVTNSLPFHLLHVLDKQDEILAASKHKYFSLSDKAAELDFDFIRSHAATRLFLSVWTKATPSLNQILDQISFYIKTTTNVVQKSMLVLDLFSLIFVRKKSDNSFVCNPYVANKLIQKLIEFDISPYISGAAKLFEKRKPHKSDQSLAPWFDRDPSIIYSAIEEKNWEVADKMTEHLPCYRKIYSRAYAAYQYLEEKIEPKQASTKLDIALSSFGTTKLLQSLKQKFKNYEPIIDERIKNPNDSIIDPIVASEKWNPVNEFTNMFDMTPLEMVKSITLYEGTTKISQTLSKFLNYLQLYYTCSKCGDSFFANSIEDLFIFDMKRVLAGPIKVGEYKKAEELAAAAKIDLIPYIFENIEGFEFESSFMNKMNNEYPIETKALAISRNHSTNEMDEETQKLAKYFESLKEKEVEPSINQLLVANQNNIDDILYKIDHEEIYSYLMKNSEEKLSTTLFHLLDVVSYVAPESDYPLLNKIYMLHSIRSISTAKNPSDIVRDIMTHDNFKLAIEYLKKCVPATAIASPLVQLFTSCLSNTSYMEEILNEFPDRYDVILSRFFHIPGILSILKNYADDKSDYINGLSLLPENIFSDSNIFEIDTVTSSYIRNYQLIFNITPEIAVLFSDDDLFAMAKGVNKTPQFHQIIAHLYKFFKNKELIIEYWTTEIENQLHKFNINSIDQEQKLNDFFRIIKQPLKYFSNQKIEILSALAYMASFYPYTKLKIPYNFLNIESEEFNSKISEICLRMDDDSFAERLAKPFHLHLDRYYLEHARIQLLFGQFNDTAKLFNKRSLKIDNYSQVQLYDTTFNFLTPLNKLSIFNQNELQANTLEKLGEGVVTPLNVYKHILKQSKLQQITIPPKMQTMMHSLILKHSNVGPAISMLISFRQFEHAYKLLMQIEDNEKKTNLFIHSFYFSVLFNNINTPFNQFLEANDPNLDRTSSLWRDLIKFFSKHQMNYGLFQVYTIRNQLEDAALIGMEIFRKCESFESQISLLGQILYCLDRSLMWRANPQSCSPPFIKSDANEDRLIHCKEISELQFQICQICFEQGTPFSHDFDLITSHEGATNVAAILYLNHQEALLNQVMRLTDTSMKDVSTKVCEVLSKESIQRIQDFWKNLKNHKASLGNNLSYNLLKALSMSSNRQYISPMIFSCFSSPEEQCKLLLEYDYIPEAFSVAQSARMKDIIPLIAHRASQLGQNVIYDNCIKALS
ncbi:hypothetical protein TRFO_09895 [Tritrichomonas foetus]|uniref:Uncharacterized protein n=1 Tax=Tritrichomonas foetus TaxID=1144522 RepID=A0A1J4JCV3_9EUKA|nr:hypothetical protein TRFO_09895 [Tritrichomonas foetus]|eukprot:OHS96513.1 hypothetical protein TRFO_09895 [Tritrichomonas foetus]